MKAIVVFDIPNDYQEYGSGDWYVVGDDLRIGYEEDGALLHYKYIDGDRVQLKPLPINKEYESYAMRCVIRDLQKPKKKKRVKAIPIKWLKESKEWLDLDLYEDKIKALIDKYKEDMEESKNESNISIK